MITLLPKYPKIFFEAIVRGFCDSSSYAKPRIDVEHRRTPVDSLTLKPLLLRLIFFPLCSLAPCTRHRTKACRAGHAQSRIRLSAHSQCELRVEREQKHRYPELRIETASQEGPYACFLFSGRAGGLRPTGGRGSGSAGPDVYSLRHGDYRWRMRSASAARLGKRQTSALAASTYRSRLNHTVQTPHGASEGVGRW